MFVWSPKPDICTFRAVVLISYSHYFRVAEIGFLCHCPDWLLRVGRSAGSLGDWIKLILNCKQEIPFIRNIFCKLMKNSLTCTLLKTIERQIWIHAYAITIASQITSVSIVCSNVCPGPYQRKYQSSASLAFVMGIYWSSVDYPHKGPVTRNSFHLTSSNWFIVFVRPRQHVFAPPTFPVCPKCLDDVSSTYQVISVCDGPHSSQTVVHDADNQV